MPKKSGKKRESKLAPDCGDNLAPDLEITEVLRPRPWEYVAGVGPDLPCSTCRFFVGREEKGGVTRGRCHEAPEGIPDKEATDWCGRRRPKPDGERLVEQ